MIFLPCAHGTNVRTETRKTISNLFGALGEF